MSPRNKQIDWKIHIELLIPAWCIEEKKKTAGSQDPSSISEDHMHLFYNAGEVA